MDDLLALPYLDAVMRETLRLHAPVPFTERIVTQSDAIPLDRSYIDKNGVEQNSVRCLNFINLSMRVLPRI